MIDVEFKDGCADFVKAFMSASTGEEPVAMAIAAWRIAVRQFQAGYDQGRSDPNFAK